MLETQSVRDSGAGAMLGLAAGDQSSSPAYGFRTQLAVLTAYQLLDRGAIDTATLRQSIEDFAGNGRDAAVVRKGPEWLGAWREGYSSTGFHGDILVQGVPIGLWHRNQPEKLIDDVLAAIGATHTNRPAFLATAAFAGAIAAASFGQSGRDLVRGAQEFAIAVDAALESRPDVPGSSEAVLETLSDALEVIGRPMDYVLARFGRERGPEGDLGAAMAVGAPLAEHPLDALGAVIELGRPGMASLVGSITGTRIGLVSWPWSIANDTWFAEIGRRLAAGHQMAGDLPDPYQVEYRLSHGPSSTLR